MQHVISLLIILVIFKQWLYQTTDINNGLKCLRLYKIENILRNTLLFNINVFRTNYYVYFNQNFIRISFSLGYT